MLGKLGKFMNILKWFLKKIPSRNSLAGVVEMFLLLFMMPLLTSPHSSKQIKPEALLPVEACPSRFTPMHFLGFFTSVDHTDPQLHNWRGESSVLANPNTGYLDMSNEESQWVSLKISMNALLMKIIHLGRFSACHLLFQKPSNHLFKSLHSVTSSPLGNEICPLPPASKQESIFFYYWEGFRETNKNVRGQPIPRGLSHFIRTGRDLKKYMATNHICVVMSWPLEMLCIPGLQ